MKPFDLHSKRPVVIAGPCSAESRAQTLETCCALAETGAVDMLRAGVWKPRTMPGSFEGSGARGLAWLAEVRARTGLPVAVEVATPRHVEAALRHGMDALWIGGRTTVSPFSMQEIADALRGNEHVTILVKNPVNPDIGLWAGAIERLSGSGIPAGNIALVHRGFSYYGENRYRNSPMWHLVFDMRTRFPGLPLLCDPSHIAGNSDLLREVAQTAADLRYDGLMVESHIRPDEALTDAAQQVTPQALADMLASIRWRRESGVNPAYDNALGGLRQEIDGIDAELVSLLARRMDVADRIGGQKRLHDVAILQQERWRDVMENALDIARELGLDTDFVRTLLEAIHMESINRQNNIMNR